MNSDKAADLERRIEETRAEISRLRKAGRASGDGPEMETQFAALAKLRAGRTRLMLRSRPPGARRQTRKG